MTTTHLEYYSARQRTAQIEALRRIQAEAAGHGADQVQAHKAGSPFETRPRGPRGIVTGDFNCGPDDPLIARMQAPLEGGAPAWRDAWAVLHPGVPHVPTIGLHDKVQWNGLESCFDFVFVTAEIAARARSIVVNRETAASDHQPVLLEIEL